MKLDTFFKMNFLKDTWEEFLYNPDKTETNIRIYFLNPFYTQLERFTFFIVDSIRSVCCLLSKK